MPPYEKSEVLEPELVVELSAAGEIIRRWSMPVDVIVSGVAGDAIFVPLKPLMGSVSDEALRISPNGQFSIVRSPKFPEAVPYTCPALQEFGDSAYLGCWEMRDMNSGSPRLLAFQGPCT
jgi:hypothetical protein